MSTLAKKAKRFLTDSLQIALVGVISLVLINIFLGQLLVVSGDSMEPTLHNKEQVFGEKLSLKLRPIERGDIVIFKDPDTHQLIIKRVIGLPDETFEIIKNRVFINGKLLKEPYKLGETQGGSALKADKPYKVPVNQFVLLGDNRKVSLDSREKGFIKRENIISRAIIIYYPLRHFRILK